jgi:hypothetical protein
MGGEVAAFRDPPVPSDNEHYANLNQKILFSTVILQQRGEKY